MGCGRALAPMIGSSGRVPSTHLMPWSFNFRFILKTILFSGHYFGKLLFGTIWNHNQTASLNPVSMPDISLQSTWNDWEIRDGTLHRMFPLSSSSGSLPPRHLATLRGFPALLCSCPWSSCGPDQKTDWTVEPKIIIFMFAKFLILETCNSIRMPGNNKVWSSLDSLHFNQKYR